jgi:hypothetical protein
LLALDGVVHFLWAIASVEKSENVRMSECRLTFRRDSISTSQARPYVWLDVEAERSCPFWKDGVLPPFITLAVDGVVGIPVAGSLETLFQLVILSLLFERTVGAPYSAVSSDVAPRTLQSSYEVKSADEGDTMSGEEGLTWVWIAVSVFLTNWLRDMREDSSATCKSVLRSNSEYDTAWTISVRSGGKKKGGRDGQLAEHSIHGPRNRREVIEMNKAHN